MSKVTNRKTVTFIISDFYDTDYEKPLSVANKRHDLVAITITDPAEFEMPNAGIIKFFDAENGKEVVVDSSDKKFRDEYSKSALNRFGERKRLFQSVNVDSVDIRTDQPYAKSLYAFFKMRGLRRR